LTWAVRLFLLTKRRLKMSLTPYPVNLDPAAWADVEQLITGTVPSTPQLILAGWNGVGFALGQIVPASPPAGKQMTRAEGAAVCQQMKAQKGPKAAIGAANWSTWLQLVLEILNAIAAGTPPVATGS
jgi:hypothetical protein